MPSYHAPVEDYLFLLDQFLRVQDRHALPGYAELTPELCAEILRGAARFHEEVIFPVGARGDAEGARLVDGQVRTPTGYREAWQAYRKAGWLGLSLPEAMGGSGLPAILSAAVGEMRMATGHSLSMYVSFCISVARMLGALGDPWMRDHVVPRLARGEWTATMCLTESHCGTDLRQIRTRAVQQDDGSWKLDGTKIFISGGDHDLADNIVHVVLAKVPDANGALPPELGAVNVFLVSKRELDPTTGALGAARGVTVGSIEHKMGIEGNATCVLNFEGARAWRLGDANGRGAAANMAAMFLLMNYARVGTALSGVAYAELAVQNARAYARERLVGRAAGGARHPELPGDPLVAHPDIRRLLAGAQSFAEGGRATALRAAMWQAEAEAPGEEERRAIAHDLMELMTPVMKAFFTDRGFTAANDCLQVLGGHGYIREYGLEQMVRNARIGQIYEGANGIQAIDLVQRKLPARGWRPARTLLSQVDACLRSHVGVPGMEELLEPLALAREQLARVFELLQRRATEAPAHNLAVAYDVLQACGIVVVAWTWAEVAATVLAHDSVAPELKGRKLVLARYWMERELPELACLLQRVEAERPVVLELVNGVF
ncbi:MAG: dmdC [Ramlibacter sp.]|jgi:alkylation response protein AidB-like acyl-CoA dehydrogenase|nr:dmdC [Ramlibacter sp.]